MNFVDKKLVHLADDVLRPAVFDQVALEQILTTAYDTSLTPVSGPFQPVFDEFRIGLSTPPEGRVNGNWSALGGAERTDLTLNVSGIGAENTVRVDAVWRGSIIARTAPLADRIESVALAWANPGTIDAEIAAALGALPADPAVLEAERRVRFKSHVSAALDQPGAFSDQRLETWLSDLGATSVGDLIENVRGTAQGATVQVQFSPPSPTPALPVPMPLVSALLVRDAGFSIADLIADTRAVRTRLEALGFERPGDTGFRVRHEILVTWVIPNIVFDDTDWPGAQAGHTPAQARDARRAAAGLWLAREGIGLVTTPP